MGKGCTAKRRFLFTELLISLGYVTLCFFFFTCYFTHKNEEYVHNGINIHVCKSNTVPLSSLF